MADLEQRGTVRHRAVLVGEQHHLRPLADSAHGLACHALEFGAFVLGQGSHVQQRAPPLPS